MTRNIFALPFCRANLLNIELFAAAKILLVTIKAHARQLIIITPHPNGKRFIVGTRYSHIVFMPPQRVIILNLGTILISRLVTTANKAAAEIGQFIQIHKSNYRVTLGSLSVRITTFRVRHFFIGNIKDIFAASL